MLHTMEPSVHSNDTIPMFYSILYTNTCTYTCMLLLQSLVYFLVHLRTTQNYLLQGHLKSATALFCVHTDVSGREGFKAAGCIPGGNQDVALTHV